MTLGTIRRSIAAGLIVVLAACSGDGSSPSTAGETGVAGESRPAPEPELFAGGDFYGPPEPLPDGEPGSLLRYEPVVDASIEGGTLWRVMYLSESLRGDPVAVTGLVVVPNTPAPAEGRPLVTVAPWSLGIADECAGSHDPNAVGLHLTAPFVNAGYVVALSDYEGLGTPGRHPYLVGESEGRSVLDAAEAATQLSDAPVTELPQLFAQKPSVTGFYLSLVAGYEAAYPEADPALVLTEAGLAALDVVDQGCIREVFDAVAAQGNASLVRTDRTSEVWADLLEDNNPGQVATSSPVLILNSLTDEFFPATIVESLFARMCAAGQIVEHRTYDSGQTHIAAAPEVFTDAFTWIDALMDGTTPARSTCP